jgi:membrane protein
VSPTRKARRAATLLDRVVGRLPRPIQKAIDRARGKDILLYSAALAFYALVSVAPLVILTMWVTSAIVGDQRIQELAKQLEAQAPKSIGVGHALDQVAKLGTSLGLPALITGLWPASAYGSGLARAFDRLSPKNREAFEGLWGRAIALLALLPMFVIGGLVGSYIGTLLLDDQGAGRVIGLILALITGFIGVAGGTGLIYWIYPPERLSFKQIRRGTIFAGTCISVMSVIFTAYLTLGADFQKHYASSGLAGIVLLALWLFAANAFLLMGYQEASATKAT